jgi:hypothetical protein
MNSLSLVTTHRSSIATVACALFLVAHSAFTQNLDYDSKKIIVLKDGTSVTLYAQLQGNSRSKNYYYLPTQVMLSKNPQTQIPQFLFLKYVTEESEAQGGISGALLHFLVQWGFSPEQFSELKAKLNADINGAEVKGPVDLFPADGESYVITSATVNEKGGLTKSIVTSGKAPLIEGGKLAIASNLNDKGAQLLAASFEKAKSITDLSVTMNYNYYLKVNGIKASIIIDYEKISSIIKQDKVNAQYRKVQTKNTKRESQSWSELHSLFQSLKEKEAVIFKLDQGIPNEVSGKLTEIVFQILLAKLTVPADDQVPTGPPTAEEKQYLPGRSSACGYYLDVKKIENSVQRKKDVIIINYNYMLAMPGQATGNLASWYNSVKDNKNCIATVNLNDPFYKHLNAIFVLDGDAVDMFDKNEINYVTINVRKVRSSGNDFTNRVTINNKFIKDNGTIAQMTYAAGEEKNPDTYQYMVQWSFKGGILYPASPAWEIAQLEATPLALPVKPHKIDFQADLDQLKAANISRVTLQVRYRKFDQEFGENIDITPVTGEALVSKVIYIDTNTRGYVYRFVYNNTTEGKLATAWKSSMMDDYQYAVIPDEFRDKNSEIFQKAIEAAKTSSESVSGKVTVDKVLDGFQEIFGVVKEIKK